MLGASFTAVTVSFTVSVVVEKAVALPVAPAPLIFAVLPLVPLVLSQARMVRALSIVPFQSAVGLK